jgi:hypothetical protein
MVFGYSPKNDTGARENEHPRSVRFPTRVRKLYFPGVVPAADLETGALKNDN